MAETDPSGNTEMFQAFVRKAATTDPEVPARRSPVGLIIGVAVAVVLLVAIVALIAMR
jgi:hypothetical protein